jgi:hypothetical protein
MGTAMWIAGGVFAIVGLLAVLVAWVTLSENDFDAA